MTNELNSESRNSLPCWHVATWMQRWLLVVCWVCSCGTSKGEPSRQSPPTSGEVPASSSTAGEAATPQPTKIQPPASPEPKAFDWAKYFGTRIGCFVGFDEATGVWTRNDEAQCNQRFRPFSTFKIPHALIGLDSGKLSGADAVIPWDSARYPAQDWWPASFRESNDLRAAVSQSIVPYFRALARRIGAETMQEYLRRLSYGNQSIAGGLDLFWLNGELKISAVEQVEFLRGLHGGTLDVSVRGMNTVKDILVRKRGPGYVLRAKTGTGRIHSGDALGWYVGWVDRDSGGYFFAMNIAGRDYDETPRRERIDKTLTILADLEVIPDP